MKAPWKHEEENILLNVEKDCNQRKIPEILNYDSFLIMLAGFGLPWEIKDKRATDEIIK